jgi:uncharacterized protein YjiS (DUF1127 family)
MTHHNINHPLAWFLAGEQAAHDHHRRPLSLDRARRAFGRHLTSAFRRWQRNRTIAALQSLDDWMLDNIGITRAEIPRVAAEVVGNSLPSQTTLEQHMPPHGNARPHATGDSGVAARNGNAGGVRNEEVHHGTR